MNTFQYIKSELCCENVMLRTLAAKYGTPVYVYSQNHIITQYRELDSALTDIDHLICFAMKANSNLAVLRALANEGAGFDIVSAGELFRVVNAGGDPSKCVFSGVGKSAEEIEYALKQGIYSFNVESAPELERISKIAIKYKRIAPIAIRVNPGVDPDTHKYISTGKHESKFGIPINQAFQVYQRAKKLRGITIRGVQMHIGSQITKTNPFVEAVQKIVPLVRKVQKLAPKTFQFLDVGGGLGIQYHNEHPPLAQQYASKVKPMLAALGLKVIFEPGRYLVGNAGALVTRVHYVKKTKLKTFVITDAGMNDLIRPSLYEGYHKILPVKKTTREQVLVDVVGPVCETGDFLALDRRMPSVAEGDLLSVMSAGAYGMAMASNYNSRGRPAEVMVMGKSHGLIRERESLKELIASEHLPKWLK